MSKRIRRTIVATGLVVAVSGGVAAGSVAYRGAPSHTKAPTVDRATPAMRPLSKCEPDTVLCRLGGTDPASFCSIEAVICDKQGRAASAPVPKAASAASQAEGVLGPIDGNLANLSGIIDGVIADPNAPLTDEQTQYLGDVTRRADHGSSFVGNIGIGDGMWDDTQRDMDHQTNEQLQHDKIYDAIKLINDQVGEINSWDYPGELSDLYTVNMPHANEPYDHDYADPGYSVPSWSPPAYSPPTYSPPTTTAPVHSPLPSFARASSHV